jgi:hypothetical protein
MKLRLSLWILSVAVAITGCAFPYAHNLPPAQQILEPGPGVGGPGPGVLPPALPPALIPITMPTVQVLFAKPEGMQVRWDVGGPGLFDSTPLIVPARQNFPQDGIYSSTSPARTRRESSCIPRWKLARPRRAAKPSWPTTRFPSSSPRRILTRSSPATS